MRGVYVHFMRYLVQERIFSIGDDFWIEDENGDRVFFVDGKALSLRETFELRDASGAIRAIIRKKLFALRDTMDIETAAGSWPRSGRRPSRLSIATSSTSLTASSLRRAAKFR